MRKVFEHAYEGASNLIVNFTNFGFSICKCVLVILIYITIPLWIIPFAIYKKLKGGAK